MKKILFAFVLLHGAIAFGQTKKPSVATPAKKTSPATVNPVASNPAAPIIKNEIDSVSYALGVSLAAYYQSQGVTKLNGALLGTAVNDLLNARTPLLDNNISNTLLYSYMTRLQSEKSKQKFTNSYEQFNYHTSHQVSLKILPLSNKNKTTEEIKHYCTECGTKTKSKYKFCPTCGNKL